MKKITFLLLTVLPLIGFSQTWDFTNTVDNWDAVTTGATLNANSTYLSVDLAEGVNNPKFGKDDAGIDASTQIYAGVTLRNSDANGPTFLRVSYPKTGGGRVYKQMDIPSGISTFETYFFDLTNASWTGIVDDIQIHFKAAGNATYTVPTGGVTVDVDKIEFLATLPTQLRESFTFDTDNDTEGWFATNGSISGPSSGILTFTPNADSFAKLEQNLFHVNADANKAIHITLKNNSASNDQLRIINFGTTISQVMTTSDSGEITYDFDMTSIPEWSGTELIFGIGIGSSLSDNLGKAFDTGTVEFSSIVVDNDVVLSTKDNTLNQFNLYPNPNNGQLNINYQGTINKVQVFDITGKQVMESGAFTNHTLLNVSHLNQGIYLVRLIDQNNNVAVKKLVIK